MHSLNMQPSEARILNVTTFALYQIIPGIVDYIHAHMNPRCPRWCLINTYMYKLKKCGKSYEVMVIVRLKH